MDLAIWLFVCAAMIVAMAIIGAITRLTESGLSIMEWAPIKGALPPMSEAEWQRLFELYQKTDEYKVDNAGMVLSEFKTIFWWEWIHRLWGRSIGLVYALPLAWFWLRGRLPAWSKPLLLAGLFLGGFQGFIGWFMVFSGFGERTDVSQYRLALHLFMALALEVYVLMLGLRFAFGRQRLSQALPPHMAGLSLSLFALLAMTLVSGAFVAGLNAGHLYNEFPLMGAGLVPGEYGELAPWWRNWFDNGAAAQFNHRLLASVTATATLLLALWGWLKTQGGLRTVFVILGLAAAGQYALGIATLLMAVPVAMGAAHQAGAIGLLTVYTILAYWVLRTQR
jgi:cytochrome c oxidase assembly protein subunit 15